MLPSETSLPQEQTQIGPKRRILTRRRAIALAIALVLILACVFAFRGVGRWLVREDPLARAGAIVVLSGSMPYRAEGAADLYRERYAPEVWLTRPESPAGALSAMGIPYTGDEDYSREVLIHDGVPAGSIHILPAVVVDTEQEIGEISRAMRDGRTSSVIIVTSPQHTRRVRALWRRLAAANQKAIIRAAPEDPFDANHWWRNTRDAYSVLRELLGLANAWLGLPVRPRSRAR